MRVSNSRQLGSVKSNIKLWETIDRIQKVLQVSDETYADLLELTLPEFFKLRSSRSELSAYSFYALNGRLNLSSERMYRGDIDYIALDRSWRGDQFYIPERYRENAYSKVGNIAPFFEYIDLHYGLDWKFDILRTCQLPVSILSDPNKDISVALALDLYSYLKKQRFSDQDFLSLGNFQTAKRLENPSVQKILLDCDNVVDVFDAYVHLITPKVENNLKYWLIQSGRSKHKICYQSHDHAKEVFLASKQSSQGLCQSRLGIAKSILYHYDHRLTSRIIKTKCEFAGDTHCELELVT